jgi:hypothetical protein
VAEQSWPLRQQPDEGVIFARSLLTDPSRLAYVVLDEEDEWQVMDGTDLDNENFVSLTVADMLDHLPQIGALADLPPGMFADWDADTRTWLLASITVDEDDDDEDQDQWMRDRLASWSFGGRPDEPVAVSVDLARRSIEPDAPKPVVCEVVHNDDGSWLFVGADAVTTPGEDGMLEVETVELDLDHVAALYPEIVDALDAEPGEQYSIVDDDEVAALPD